MIALLVLLALLIFGAIYFSWAEGWSLIDSFYFSAATITTLGYGDLVPTHDASKIVATVYALVSIPSAFIAFGIVAEKYIEVRLTRMEASMNKMMKSEKEIEKKISKKN